MLRRKLWRDIKQNWGAYLACVSVLVIGLMMYVSLALILESLTDTQQKYYREHSFADGFAQIVKGPAGLADDVGKIPGVGRAVGRVVQNVFVHKPKGEENTTLRLVSFSDQQPVNRCRLEEGKIPTGGQLELLVTPVFLKANHYKIGDRIPLILQGREIKFTITGTANSPEYTYEIPSGQTLTPDPKVFGVAFIHYDTIAPLAGMEGQINDIAFTLDGGTEFAEVKRPVNRVLEHYGLTQLYPRKDQLSHSLLSNEITQLKGSVKTTPVIFLLVAAGILYIMLRRMVEQQRGQIGILKAFGFKDREIISHYLSYAVLIGGVGGLGGGLAGIWLSFTLAKMYQQYYNLPDLTGKVSISYLLIGTLLSLAFSLAAGYQGCKGVLSLSPAEAMRAPAPKTGGRTLLERVGFLWQILSTQGKMAVRNVFRSKQRSVLAILGIAAAFSLIVATAASYDAIYYLIDFQYGRVERYDIKVGLRNYVDETAGLTAAKNIPGVAKAEPLLEIPVTMSNKWLRKDLAITGLPSGASLYRLMTDKGTEVVIPDNGLVVSTQLAKILDIKIGDRVTVKPLVGDVTERQVTVRKIVPLFVGLGAYMELHDLSSLMGEPAMTSSVLVKVNPARLPEVRKALQEGKNIAAIHDKSKLKAQFEELMESSKASQFIFLSFALVMGFAIVYNLNLISLSEREREMATLMVLGMTEREIARILLFEQGLLSLTAIIVGVPMSYGLLWALINANSNEIFNMPLVLRTGSMVQGLACTVVFLLAAQWKMKGKVGKLSMLDVLKQQD